MRKVSWEELEDIIKKVEKIEADFSKINMHLSTKGIVHLTINLLKERK